jgi:hypothetical protein
VVTSYQQSIKFLCHKISNWENKYQPLELTADQIGVKSLIYQNSIVSFMFMVVCFYRCLSFVLFLLAIVLSVLLRFTDSDYPFGIVKAEQSLERTFHRCFLPSFSSFGRWISEEKIKMWKFNGPLKPLGQLQINRKLVGSIYGRSSIKIANFTPICSQTSLP